MESNGILTKDGARHATGGKSAGGEGDAFPEEMDLDKRVDRIISILMEREGAKLLPAGGNEMVSNLNDRIKAMVFRLGMELARADLRGRGAIADDDGKRVADLRREISSLQDLRDMIYLADDSLGEGDNLDDSQSEEE